MKSSLFSTGHRVQEDGQLNETERVEAQRVWHLHSPGGTAVVAGDRAVQKRVKPQLLVQILRGTRVQRLRQALDLSHETVHVPFHSGKVQREALHRLPSRFASLSGRRGGLLLRSTPPPVLPALSARTPMQEPQEQQHLYRPSTHRDAEPPAEEERGPGKRHRLAASSKEAELGLGLGRLASGGGILLLPLVAKGAWRAGGLRPLCLLRALPCLAKGLAAAAPSRSLQ